MDEACDDDDPVRLEAPGVVLERETGCARWLQWSVQLEGASAEDVARALPGRGHENSSRLPGLTLFTLPGRHQLLLVPATGRIQLRLDIGVPRDGRPDEALRLGRWLVAELGG